MQYEELKIQLTEIRENLDDYWRVRRLEDLIRRLDEELLTQAYQEILDIGCEIKEESLRAQILFGLVFETMGKTQEKMLDAIREIKDGRIRNRLLEGLVVQLDHDLRKELLNIAHGIKDDHVRNRLPEHLHEFVVLQNRDVLQQKFYPQDEEIRTEVLIHLVRALNNELGGQALETIRKTEEEDARAGALVDFERSLENIFKTHPLDAVSEIKDERIRAKSLLDIARLNADLRRQVLDEMHRIRNEEVRSETLLKFTAYLNNELKVQAFKIIQEIENEPIRRYTLERFVDDLKDGDVIQSIFEASLEIEDQRVQDFTVSLIVRNLDERGIHDGAIKIARSIKDEIGRAQLLVLIAQRLHGEFALQVLEEAQDAIHKARERGNLHYYSQKTEDLVIRINTEIEKRTPKSIPVTSKSSDQKPSDSMMDNVTTEETDHAPTKNNIAKPSNSMIANHSNRVKEQVFFTAYHPEKGDVETWHTLLVYTHIASALAKVRENARYFEDQIRIAKETSSQASKRLKRGTQMTIVPACEGVIFNPQQITFEWVEDFHGAGFRFKADQSLLNDAAKGQIIIYAGPLIIGTLKFAMLFDEKAATPVFGNEEHAQMYGRDDVFISYSRRDTEVARAFKNVLDATGFDVFLDVDDIKSGQYWNIKLMEKIERARIFQIFWSSNYERSENCAMEWKHALKQNKEEGYIRPVYWKNPLSPKPPKELSKFNFRYVEIPREASWFDSLRTSLQNLANSISNLKFPTGRLNSRVMTLIFLMLTMCLLICLTLFSLYILDLKR